MVLLDSDVLFMNKIEESAFDVQNHIKIRYNRDHDHSQRDPLFYHTEIFMKQHNIEMVNKISKLNSGSMILSSDVFNINLLVDYIFYLYKQSSLYPLMEQDSWNVLASTVPVEALPDSYVVGDFTAEFRDNLKKEDIISIHYVRGIRYRSFNYLMNGLEIVKKIL